MKKVTVSLPTTYKLPNTSVVLLILPVREILNKTMSNTSRRQCILQHMTFEFSTHTVCCCLSIMCCWARQPDCENTSEQMALFYHRTAACRLCPVSGFHHLSRLKIPRISISVFHNSSNASLSSYSHECLMMVKPCYSPQSQSCDHGNGTQPTVLCP